MLEIHVVYWRPPGHAPVFRAARSGSSVTRDRDSGEGRHQARPARPDFPFPRAEPGAKAHAPARLRPDPGWIRGDEIPPYAFWRRMSAPERAIDERFRCWD